MTRVEMADALPRAGEIVAVVRARGDEAVLEWSERLDGERPASLRVPPEEIAAAEAPPAFLAALRRLADAVRAFHEPQRPLDTSTSPYPGVQAARRFVPVRSVGVYAPGGRASYPSSLVMAAVTQRLPGPTILSTARIVSVPYASAAIACAPPTA